MLRVDVEVVAKYLGFGNRQIDVETQLDIQKATKLLVEVAKVKVVSRVFRLQDDYSLEGTNVTLLGTDIRKLLQDSEQCILLAVTLGQEVDTLIRKLQVIDLNLSMIVDFCASSMVEAFCDDYEEELAHTLGHLYFTDRFSAGYGDFPIKMQNSMCQVLQTQQKIGMTVTRYGIMVPRKSITAIIGIADIPQPKQIKGCKVCKLFENCTYRKREQRCD